ncbi:MAG TPA: hypothetical protein VHA35_24845 [Dongiaceae bacterium]|jgi:hypothetical protein|nr:hypothetical protein [Dongiaceae bacterium]
MRKIDRVSTALSALTIAFVFSTAAAVAQPNNEAAIARSDCPQCWRDQGKTDDGQADNAAAGDDQNTPADQGGHDKVAQAAPAKGAGGGAGPDDGPLKALDDAGPADQPQPGDDVAVAAPAQDVAPEDAPDDGMQPAKARKVLADDQLALADQDEDHGKKKKSGPSDEHNARGEHGGGNGSGHGGGTGGGHNADGSPK